MAWYFGEGMETNSEGEKVKKYTTFIFRQNGTGLFRQYAKM